MNKVLLYSAGAALMGAATAAECDLNSLIAKLAGADGVDLTACYSIQTDLTQMCKCITSVPADQLSLIDCEYSGVNLKCTYDHCADNTWEQACAGLPPSAAPPAPTAAPPTDAPAPTDGPEPTAAPEPTPAAAPTSMNMPATCTDAGKDVMKYIGVLTNPTAESVGALCADNGDMFRAEIENLLNVCDAPEELNEAMEIVERTLCMQNRRDGYCLVTLLNVLPVAEVATQLVADPESFDPSTLDFYANLQKESSLENICAEEQKGCPRMVAKTAINLMHEYGVGEYADEVKDLAKATSAACAEDGDDNFCWLRFSDYFDTTAADFNLNLDNACKDGKIVKCARKLLTSMGIDRDDLNDPCGATEMQEVAKATLLLPNLKYKFYDDNEELIMGAITRDLSWSTALLDGEIKLDVDRAKEGEGVEVHIEISSRSLSGDEVVSMLESLQEQLVEQIASFPTLDMEPADAFVDVGALMSDGAELVEIENVDDNKDKPSGSGDGPDNGSIDDDTETTSGAATYTTSLALIMAAAVAAQ